MNRFIRPIALLALALVCVAIPATAQAQERPRDGIQDQIDECLGDRFYPTGPPPVCVFDEDGNLIDRETPGERRGMPGGLILLLGLLWIVIPMAIGASIASSRGQSVAVALLITLFLGWIGLALVWFLFTPENTNRVTTAVENVTSPRPDVADQIRKLGELKNEGLLTEEEFQAKKTQLLEAPPVG